jgi:hypothetical protein
MLYHINGEMKLSFIASDLLYTGVL